MYKIEMIGWLWQIICVLVGKKRKQCELCLVLLTHGSVPDDGLAVSEAGLDVGESLGSDVESHPALLDVVDVNDLQCVCESV